MSTSIFRVEPDDLDPHLVALAADVLRGGGLVAFPTETVYGLGGHAFDETAITRIFSAKGRPDTDPLIVHLHSMTQLAQVAHHLPSATQALADAFWPGPLTLILPRHPSLPLAVTAGRETVAVRIPSHPLALDLLTRAGVPIAAPSANRFGHTSPTSATHVQDDLDGLVDVILDGGATPIGIESTVLDLTGDVPTVLRPGHITLEQLRDHLPNVTYQARTVDSDHAATSPGQLAKHYAPDAEVLLYQGERGAVLATMEREARARRAAGQRVGVIVPNREAGVFIDEGVSVATIGDSHEEQAAQLYEALRRLEQAGVSVILAHDVEREGLGLALWDRLLRAAAGRVIQV